MEACKGHKGPLTQSIIDLSDHLYENQLIEEITYIRNTTHLHIKTINGKIKVQKLPVKELVTNIRNAINAQSSLENDIERLIKELL